VLKIIKARGAGDSGIRIGIGSEEIKTQVALMIRSLSRCIGILSLSPASRARSLFVA
jgi:hypothetical protein